MKLIVGLGNPGASYIKTRHNVGILFVEELGKHTSNQFKIYKSDHFMNESGSFVREICNKHSLQSADLFVAHDDLDIPLGEFKIQFGKGPKDHNGLISIENELGTNAYWHIRIGVDNRDPDNRTPGEQYVLENFKDDERKILDEVIKKACHKLVSDFK